MNQKIKISQLPAKGSNLAEDDLLEVAEFTGTGYISKSITGQEIIDAAVGNVDWGDIGGTLSDQTDLQTALNAKQDTLVSGTNIKTINGTSVLGSGDISISTGLTVGTTPITSGTIGRVLFQGTGNVLQQSSSLFWDNTNSRLGIGTSTPDTGLTIVSGNTYDAIRFKGASSSASGYLATGGTSAFFSSGADASGSYVQVSSTEAIINGVSILAFYTASTEKARIFSTGNFAIGTTTDAGFKLDVNGTARVQGAFTGLGNATLDGANLSYRIVAQASGFYNFNVTNSSLVAQGGLQVNVNGNEVRLYANTNYDSTIYAGNTEALRINRTTRNVLINTTTDAGYRLDVNGTARVSGDVLLTNGILASTSGTTRLQSVLNFFSHNRLGSSGVFGWDIRVSNSQQSFWTYDGASGFTRFGSNAYGVEFYTNNTLRTTISQGGDWYIGTNTLVPSAIMTIESTTKGFLPPRMTTTQKNAISTPATGLQVFDTTLNQMSYYNGTTWINL